MRTPSKINNPKSASHNALHLHSSSYQVAHPGGYNYTRYGTPKTGVHYLE